jgi:hypothetical protein
MVDLVRVISHDFFVDILTCSPEISHFLSLTLNFVFQDEAFPIVKLFYCATGLHSGLYIYMQVR